MNFFSFIYRLFDYYDFVVPDFWEWPYRFLAISFYFSIDRLTFAGTAILTFFMFWRKFLNTFSRILWWLLSKFVSFAGKVCEWALVLWDTFWLPTLLEAPLCSVELRKESLRPCFIFCKSLSPNFTSGSWKWTVGFLSTFAGGNVMSNEDATDDWAFDLL